MYILCLGFWLATRSRKILTHFNVFLLDFYSNYRKAWITFLVNGLSTWNASFELLWQPPKVYHREPRNVYGVSNSGSETFKSRPWENFPADFCTSESSKNQSPVPWKKHMIKVSELQKCKILPDIFQMVYTLLSVWNVFLMFLFRPK